MSFKAPYRQHNYMGEHANDAACLTFIQANKWDTSKDGLGNPEIGMTYYNTGSNTLMYYNGSSWVGGGVTDHGALTGLGDDDHTQYILADGTRAFTGAVSGVTPTANAHLATKEYVDQHRDWQESVLDKDLSTPPGSPTQGDRYIVASGGTGDWSGKDNQITTWNGSAWTFFVPDEGCTTRVEDENKFYVFDGAAWGSWDSVTDHGLLLGLGDDDHSQYHNDTRGDSRYYQKTEFLQTSAGATDAGKPIKLDADGNIDASMINDGDVDHGGLGGLSDDDHSQYHNDTRGDARYRTQSELSSTTPSSEGAALIGTDTKTNLASATTVEAALTELDTRNPPKRGSNAGNPNGSVAGVVGDLCLDTTNDIPYVNVDGTNTGWMVQ